MKKIWLGGTLIGVIITLVVLTAWSQVEKQKEIDLRVVNVKSHALVLHRTMDEMSYTESKQEVTLLENKLSQLELAVKPGDEQNQHRLDQIQEMLILIQDKFSTKNEPVQAMKKPNVYYY